MPFCVPFSPVPFFPIPVFPVPFLPYLIYLYHFCLYPFYLDPHIVNLTRYNGRKGGYGLFNDALNTFYGYMASDIWLRTILIVRKETRCRHIGYSFRLTARGILYASSHRQDNTYHSLCYASRGALAGTRNSSMGPPHEESIRRPIAPWANALTTELHLVPLTDWSGLNSRANRVM